MRTWVIVALLALLAMGEIRLFDRLLYQERPELSFVVESVDGVLHGRPVSKSWSHRLLAPLLIVALERVAGWELRRAVQRFAEGALALSVVVAFIVLRRRGVTAGADLLAIAAYGLVHAACVYKLEYPWDGVDVLLFLWFGGHAARGGSLARAWPIIAVGALNHETILYVPLWYLLAPVEGGARRARTAAGGGLVLALLVVIIAALRQRLYVGRPAMPEAVFETATPIIENHWHVLHNSSALFVNNWSGGRVFNSVLVLSMVAAFVLLLRRAPWRRAAVWSLIVMVTITCFGYLNETRHYLGLMAFWLTYAWPPSAPEVACT
jgi:hypothetical protein